MTELIPGRGLIMTKQYNTINGHEISAAEISVGKIDPMMIDSLAAKPGDVLMYNEFGYIEWKKPFDDDGALRKEYPALEEAWGSLMEALGEYQMVKKLVQDHDKS